MRISWYETRKWPTKHFGYHPQLLGIYFPYGYTTDTDISSLQRIHNLRNRKQRRQEYTWKVLFYIFSLAIIFFPFWSVIMYVLKIQIVSCALHTLPIPSNFERKHDNCQKVMAAVWRVYNFLFIEKKIFDAFLLIFSRTVVRSHRSREGEGDLACIEKNREEEALFAQKLQFSYHFDKVPLSFIPFLRLSRQVFLTLITTVSHAASIVESWQLLHRGGLNPSIISWMSCNLHWSKDYLTLLLNTG